MVIEQLMSLLWKFVFNVYNIFLKINVCVTVYNRNKKGKVRSLQVKCEPCG